MKLLSIQDLHVAYGAITALHGISLHINSGEIVALIGSNGAGKTTLLHTISGLIRPKSGSMPWKPDEATVGLKYSTCLQTLAPHAIVRIGISHVPEGRQVFANLSVRENLLLGAYQRTDRPEIKEDLDRYYTLFPVLGERRDQRAGTLSGGEQQMLAIARALMARPTLLLLDEPSLGLAPLVVRTIFQTIRQINSQGTTIFLVEQNAHMALSVAHRAYVLQTGQVIKTDLADRLLDDPEVKKAYLGG